MFDIVSKLGLLRIHLHLVHYSVLRLRKQNWKTLWVGSFAFRLSKLVFFPAS